MGASFQVPVCSDCYCVFCADFRFCRRSGSGLAVPRIAGVNALHSILEAFPAQINIYFANILHNRNELMIMEHSLGFFGESATMQSHDNYDKEVDVLVVGSGAGALTAAVVARQEGCAEVLVVEKSDRSEERRV